MELQKKSELSVGRLSFVISTELAGDAAPSIETKVIGGDGTVVFQTSQDISALKPIFQNSQKVFTRLEAQHHAVVKELQQGRIGQSPSGPASAEADAASDRETDALAHAVELLGKKSYDKATAALRAVLETYPNCSEARELLEVAYKAASAPRLSVEVVGALKRGTEAFAGGRQREAIESWKQCLIEEPENRRLQLLVLLATTWSAPRRQKYAAEVLSTAKFLSSGRPEEAQALLLVTQTVEGPPGMAKPAASPAPAPEPKAAGAKGIESRPLSETITSVADETMVDSSDLEALVPEYVATTEGAFDRSEDDDEGVAAASRPATPPPDPPPTSDIVKKETRPELRSSASRPALGRKPAPPARRGNTLLIAGAVAGALIVLGSAAFWLLSGPRLVSPAVLEQTASLVSAGQYPQAIAAYDELVRDFGDSAQVYLGRGRAKLASGDTEGGLADLKRAHELDPSSAAIAEEIADVLYSQSNFPEAIGYYDKAFASGDGSVEGRYRVAVSLVREGRADDAMKHLESAIAKDPAHGEAQFLYGQLLNERGRYEEAEKTLRSAEPHVEAGGDYLNQLGVALLEQQKLEAAEEIAHDFIRAYPEDARARALLGEIYLSRKQYEPARAQLIQSLRTDPRDPRAQLALGRTWLAIGKARNDAQDLSKAQQVLATAQGVPEGKRLLALGQVALAEGKLDEAQRLLQQGLENGAPELPVHLSLAEAKWRAKDLVGVAEELQRASSLAPGDPAVALSLAITYFQLKDNTRAADQFLKAIQGTGLVTPPGEGSGPVVLPEPHVPLPDRFNVNRAIRDSCQAILKDLPDDTTATQLRTLSEATTFIIGSAS